MRNFLSILSFLLISCSFTYSQEKKVKVDGVVYVIDIDKGTASVGQNYKRNLKGTVEGDVVLVSSITYKNNNFPVTSIGANAFLGCDRLNSITISSTVRNIYSDAFSYAKNLKQLNVVSDNPYFQSMEGILFNKDMTEIVSFPPGRTETSYSISSTVVTIGEGAFSHCCNLKNIVIPLGVKYIKHKAFDYCSFELINIPNSVIEIEKESFHWCINLISITLPPSVSKVGEQAFYFCYDLISVAYQNKELFFPSNAFEKCSKLSTNKIVYEAPTALFLELAQKGNSEDQYKLAMCYLTGDGFPKDVNLAKLWFEKASENGHTPSQKALGDLYFNGIGVERNYDEAVKWYSLAAESYNSSAQKALADCYFRGLGVKLDFPTAINNYKSAARQGDNAAEEILGHCYYSGDGGIDVDYKEAVRWFTLAANEGNAEAAYYLAICYSGGQGIDKNNSEALKWVEKAVDGGIEKGQGLYCVLAYDDAVNNMNLKYYSSAILGFTSVLKYEKDNIDAYINRGYCYLNQQAKDYSNSEKDFKKALELDENNVTARNNLQVVTEYYQRIKDAKNLCDEGYQYYKQKNYTNAVASCAKSISLDNTKPYPYYLIGYCYFDCAQYADAINYFDQALSVDPNYTNATKARKSARTILVLNAVSGALSTVSNSLNNAYSSSVNYGSSSSYSPSSNSTSSVSSSAGTQRKCTWCNGTGKCDFCNSLGQSKTCLSYSFGVTCTDSWCIEHNHRCKQCGGTHVCSNCKGTGYK